MISDPDATELGPLEAEADRAAGRGDLGRARVLLEQIVAFDPARIDNWLKLAAIRRGAGDFDGAAAAIGGALAVDPLHFMALLSHARLLETAGKPAEAGRAYLRALAQLSSDDPIPPGLLAAIEHGRVVGERYRAAVAETWTRAAAADPALSVRERRDLDRFTSNTVRRTQVFHSDPSHYHYPGLVEREFHPREDFPWLGAFEAATPAIVAELEGLLRAGTARSEPYIQYAAGTPVRQWAALNHSLDWTAFHLLHGGRDIAANTQRCPVTMALLASIDQPRILNRSPNAMFSLLKPHTRIPPHTGIANTRLVCHLPLVVPDGCWFRVGAERREWRPGEAFVFDDTIEHEAANDSDQPRFVLIFDIWHPGLNAAARAAVARMMEADEAEYGATL